MRAVLCRSQSNLGLSPLRIDLELNGPCTCLGRDMVFNSSLAWWHTPSKVAVEF